MNALVVGLSIVAVVSARAPVVPVEGPPDDVVREVIKSLEASAVEHVALERYALFGLDALSETERCLGRKQDGANLVLTCGTSTLTVAWPPKSSDDVAILLSNAMRLADPDHSVRTDVERVVARALTRAVDDPFTAYLPPELVAQVTSKNTAMFAATAGVEVWPRDPTKVREVRRGSDAARTGVEAGDRIVSIDDVPVGGLTFPEIAFKLQGANDSIVRFTMKTSGGDKQFHIARTLVPESDVVTTQLDNHVLYIQLPVFKQGIAQRIKQALYDVRPTGVILDLRHNGGGFVPEATALADLFLSDGPIAALRGGAGRPTEEYVATKSNDDVNVPLVLLVDGGSASASELFAMALKERKRAVVLGIQTSGKGTVQRQIHMPDGGVLKVTAGYYVGPAGNRLGENGVTPDRFLAPAAAKTVLEGGDPRRDSWILSALDALQGAKSAQAAHSGAGPDP